MTRTLTIQKIAAVALVGLLGAVLLGAQKTDQADVLLQAAINKEMVQGDLKAAVEQYKKLADGSDKTIAAKALLRLAGCYEKLGQDDAKKVYERILRDFAGYTEAASEARTRLTALTRPGPGTTSMVARQIWEDAPPDWNRMAAIAPDGRYLVYVGPGALYVRDLPTGLNRRLTLPASAGDTARPNGALTFSPDGKLLASGWWDRVGTGRTEMRFVTLDGSAPPVFRQGQEWNALAPNDWSADGKQVLAVGNHIVDGHTYIVLVSVADGSVRELKALGMNYHHQRMMSLSRDGRYVVYDQPARGDSGERDIFILSTHGGQETRLVARAADDRYPCWTPDGSGVLFLSTRAGSTGAWFLPVVDGKAQGSPELVKGDMGQIVPIGFTRNGSLYYSEQREMGELYLATLDSTSGTITSQPATVTQRLVTTTQGGVWSPNGQYLAYSSRRPSAQGEVDVVVIRSIQTGDEYELAPALRSINLQDWSPDSRALLVTARDKDGRGGAYQVDARTGDVALFALTGGPGLDTANWLRNGKSIVFARSGEGEAAQRQIVERDLGTGQETEWYRAPASLSLYYVEVSADGRHVAFILRDPAVRAAGASLMVMTAAGETPRKLDPRLKASEEVDSILGLTPDSRQVLFNSFDPKQRERGYRYWRIGVEGGTDPQEIQLKMDRPVYVEQMNFHPDGKRIAFTAYSMSKNAVWVMENFLPKAGAAR